MTPIDVAKQAYTAAKRDHDAASLVVGTLGPIVGDVDYTCDWFAALNRAYDYAERAIMLIEREYPQFGEDDEQGQDHGKGDR